jgi:hypothetical protein
VLFTSDVGGLGSGSARAEEALQRAVRILNKTPVLKDKRPLNFKEEIIICFIFQPPRKKKPRRPFQVCGA